MVEIKGKGGIAAKIIADSVNESSNRLVTYELTYPRIIHSELLTHKMLCSNSASSRAIPFAKMAEQLTARPVRFGQANPGMQDKGDEYTQEVLVNSSAMMSPANAWQQAKDSALKHSEAFFNAGFHKQVYNRLTEPFQMMKTVISGTEWDNFFWLRNDKAADPTLHELARCMFEAREQSVPQLLKAGEWHLPYVDCDFSEWTIGSFGSYPEKPSPYSIEVGKNDYTVIRQLLTLEEAIKVSCARTAAVSFRNEDYGLEKCLEVYDKLINSDRVHASATQHCATPMLKNYTIVNEDSFGGDYINATENPKTWENGVSHADRNGQLWSAQYKGWIMHRKTIPGENYTG